ncbi:MAG: DUF559 domain-containing protein [Acidimicrobiales bacterium]|jgi:hypothetical protein|nr:DUF559 domain-containing protein [Acidimicrobiales bacterium]
MREISDLAQKAASQYGLLRSTDLTELGVTRQQKATLVNRGVLCRERRGLFVLAGTAKTWEFQLMRECLGAAGRGVVSHRSAMRLWDLRPWETSVEVTVRGFAAPTVDGAVVHRSYDLLEGDVRHVAGLRVTSPVRALVDAGAYFRDWEVERAFDAAIRTGLVSSDEIWSYRVKVGRNGRSGVTAVDRVLGETPTDIDVAESPMEIELMRLLDRYGLPTPVPQYPVQASGESFRVDFAYPDERLLLECDGYREHIAPGQFERDRRRQNLLVLDGWTVLRFAKTDVRQRPAWLAS